MAVCHETATRKVCKMTITVTYANIPVNELEPNVSLVLLPLTGLSHAVERTEQNGSVKIADYVLKGTSPAAPTTMSLRQQVTKEGGRRNSFRLSTNVTTTDSVSGESTDAMHEVVIAWNHPGLYLESPSGMSDLIQAAFSILLGGFHPSTGAPLRATLDDMNYGIVNGLE